jgi:hypothetical protein
MALEVQGITPDVAHLPGRLPHIATASCTPILCRVDIGDFADARPVLEVRDDLR